MYVRIICVVHTYVLNVYIHHKGLLFFLVWARKQNLLLLSTQCYGPLSYTSFWIEKLLEGNNALLRGRTVVLQNTAPFTVALHIASLISWKSWSWKLINRKCRVGKALCVGLAASCFFRSSFVVSTEEKIQ